MTTRTKLYSNGVIMWHITEFDPVAMRADIWDEGWFTLPCQSAR